jgi:methionyl-tRNA formyltransferase
MPLRVVFLGTPQFAADVLEYLVQNNVSIVGVISRPDKPVGRSSQLVPVPVKQVALRYGLPLYQPEKVSDPAFQTILDSFHADLFVVVAYGEILRQAVLDTPKWGCINLHPSLLPKYRGAAPIQQAIIHGETTTGVSVMYLVKKMDAGDVIAQIEQPLPIDMTYGELEEILGKSGSQLLLEVIQKFEVMAPKGTPQDESQVTFAHKIELEQCELYASKSAVVLHNLVRGVNPEPGAWVRVLIGGQEKRLKVFKTVAHPELSLEQGLIAMGPQKKVIMGCSEGALEFKEVQLEGKKRMSGQDFINGLPSKSCKVVSPD